MRFLRYALLGAIVFSASADVTVRYHLDVKPTSFMPAGMTDQVIHFKGNKSCWTMGGLTMVADFARQEITLIDGAHKTYATVPVSQYAAKAAAALPGLLEAQKALGTGALAPKVSSRKTGRAETIQGLQAEEQEITFTIGIPMPEGVQPSGLEMKMVSRVWTSKPEEILRVSALRELAGLALWQQYFLGPSGMLAGIGGEKNALATAFNEISKSGAVILRMQMETYMNAPSQAPDTPVMQMSQEMVELSSAAVDAALFQVPREYTAAPFGDMLKSALQSLGEPAPKAAESPAAPRANGVEAFVPMLNPLHQVEPVYPDAARAQDVYGIVELLVTVDPQGNVAQAEPLTGPAVLRPAAIDAVRQWKFHPVLRNGRPVAAYTAQTVDFFDERKGAPVPAFDIAEEMTATQRLSVLAREMPRSPQQVLADLEQDSGGADPMRRFYALDQLAKAALDAGEAEKATTYARELLGAASQHPKDWNYGNAILDGNMVLGLVALRKGDVATARQMLLDAGRTPGSPQLNSFGPDMLLAKELLEKGEKDAVLQYFSLCRSFWKSGAERLDAWSETVRNGGTPDFGVNAR